MINLTFRIHENKNELIKIKLKIKRKKEEKQFHAIFNGFLCFFFWLWLKLTGLTNRNCTILTGSKVFL